MCVAIVCVKCAEVGCSSDCYQFDLLILGTLLHK